MKMAARISLSLPTLSAMIEAHKAPIAIPEKAKEPSTPIQSPEMFHVSARATVIIESAVI